MIRITETKFNEISPDYRGKTATGKRTCFLGCIQKHGMTALAVEGRDFEIIPIPVKTKRRD